MKTLLIVMEIYTFKYSSSLLSIALCAFKVSIPSRPSYKFLTYLVAFEFPDQFHKGGINNSNNHNTNT
jgi:hypothetical protein